MNTEQLEDNKRKRLAETKVKIEESKKVIKRMYLDKSDDRPWAVAYSGGKDSTAVAGLVVSVIESLPKEDRWRNVHFRMADTQMENPLVHEHMVEQHDLINKYAKEKDLPIDVKVVSRPVNDSYFVLTLGRGYPLPLNNGQGRWCTDRLKIKPSANALKEINPSYILTGVRHAESAARSKSIDKNSLEEFIGVHNTLKETKTLNPIIYWSIEDVWKFLMWEGLSWGSTMSVRTIYKDATGECGFSNPTSEKHAQVEVCGARHGCWNCPVVLKDKSTEKMSEKHSWLEPYTEWRKLQLIIYGYYKPDKKEGMSRKERSEQLKKANDFNDKIKLVTKAGYGRKGKKRMKDGQGTLTYEARKFLYDKLLETELKVNELRLQQGLTPTQTLTQEEKDLIHKLWEHDKTVDTHVYTNQLNLTLKDIENEVAEMMIL